MKSSFFVFSVHYIPAVVLAAAGFVAALTGALVHTYQTHQRNTADEEIRLLDTGNRRMQAKINELTIQCRNLRNPAVLRQSEGSKMLLKDIVYDQVLRVKVSKTVAGTIRPNDLSPRDDAIELSKTMSLR